MKNTLASFISFITVILVGYFVFYAASFFSGLSQNIFVIIPSLYLALLAGAFFAGLLAPRAALFARPYGYRAVLLAMFFASLLLTYMWFEFFNPTGWLLLVVSDPMHKRLITFCLWGLLALGPILVCLGGMMSFKGLLEKELVF